MNDLRRLEMIFATLSFDLKVKQFDDRKTQQNSYMRFKQMYDRFAIKNELNQS